MENLEYVKDLLKRNALALTSVTFGVVALVASICIYMQGKKNFSECEPCEVLNDSKVVANLSEEEKNKTIFKVDVKGAIKKPGVYEVKNGSTVMDVITQAGGVTSKGVTSNINLSKRVKDEMVIYVFTKAEIQAREAANEVVCEVPKCECETIVVEECASKTESTDNDKTDANTNNTPTTNKKVSINKAGISELTTLDGIGEAKAQAIIDYREKNGAFKTLEDLMNVSGIGEKAFEKIKDNIEL